MRSITKLLYLHDPQVYNCTAVVQNMQHDERGNYLVLDQTPFYPARGGQQSEDGTIQGIEAKFNVIDVRLYDGEARHYGSFHSGSLKIGDRVLVEIDSTQRLFHNRIHSAGELICAAVKKLGYEDWYVSSAIHYEDRMSVEYKVTVDESAKESLRNKLQNQLDELVLENSLIEISMVDDIKVAEKMCGFKPEYLTVGEPIRLVTLAGNTRPCMGSHVASTSKIGAIRITKVKSKKGLTVINYSVE